MFYPIQMKFLLASETAERHVADIAERDEKEMGMLIQAAQEVREGARDIVNLQPQDFEHFFANLSEDWNFFDQEVFLVSSEFPSFSSMYHDNGYYTFQMRRPSPCLSIDVRVAQFEQSMCCGWC